ncbi:MAG: hypothetical protein A3F67_08660 [Verrucomicrobia bacterium RIFCSPHIGHO2_12_FULL_41_10]|nr:MAG: hypothetical protein A3F67_08660 [Verrucomicrobia bacterium RIFCSPHIGHO2_12_FULL_41_10]
MDACSASTELLETPEVIAKNRRERVQLWQVVVHNDPVNLMSYVTMVFCKIFGFNKQISEKHMLEVHHHGRSILWVGDREQAELYVQKLHAELLLATLEPAL